MTRSLLALALLLGACSPETQVVEDRRYQDMEPTAGGEATDPVALEHVRRGIALVQAQQCPRAMAEGFEPALAIFAARYGDAIPRASRIQGSELPGPEVSDTLYLEAFCLVELGETERAAALLERALTVIPGDVVYACELGHIRQGEQRHQDALRLFGTAVEYARALRQTPGMEGTSLFGQSLVWWEGRALRGIGYTQYELGDFAAAEAAYRQALALDPNDERALQELQLIATRRGAI
ncbi:MAG: tetratricopeptide repeat protein [Sandaracinaceae bacterium]